MRSKCTNLEHYSIKICINAKYCVSFFDPKNQYTDLAASVLAPVSILVVFDFIQLAAYIALDCCPKFKQLVHSSILL